MKEYINSLAKNSLEYYLDYNKNSQIVSQDSISEVLRANLDCIAGYDNYKVYIKKYYKPSKKWLRVLFSKFRLVKSRAKSEYENLSYFKTIGFNTPEILYFAESKGRACIITKELENSTDLFNYFSKNKINPQNFQYLIKYIEILKEIHCNNFIHRDYKLRNVLLSTDGELFLIDCPSGFKDYLGGLTNKFRLRDLAITYKDLRKILNRKQLLLLFKVYFNITSLKLCKKNRIILENIIKLV